MAMRRRASEGRHRAESRDGRGEPVRDADPSPRDAMQRRRFLKALCTVPAGIAAAGQLAAAAQASPGGPGSSLPSASPMAPSADGEAPGASSGLPQVPFGPHRISRLVCGSNPFHAGSHLSIFVNHDMRSWYTEERVLATLRRCQEEGINLWQGNDRHFETFRRFLEGGGKMQYISLGTAGQGKEYLKKLAAAGAIGVAHHGEVTDRLFKAGGLDEIRDFLEMVRDAGLQVGVSTHMPDVVDAVESKGWDIDFYMTCAYERHRSRDDLIRLLGRAPVDVGEVYLEDDPPRMFRAVQGTRRTCLAFKILAAGRLSDRKEHVEEAFRRTFQSIKPTDAVIVGIWDKYGDQTAENAAYARRFSALSRLS